MPHGDREKELELGWRKAGREGDRGPVVIVAADPSIHGETIFIRCNSGGGGVGGSMTDLRATIRACDEKWREEVEEEG